MPGKPATIASPLAVALFICTLVLGTSMDHAEGQPVDNRPLTTTSGAKIMVPCKVGTFRIHETSKIWECEVVHLFEHPAKTPKGRVVEIACMDRVRFWPNGQMPRCKLLLGFKVDNKPTGWDLLFNTTDADVDVQCKGETAFLQDGVLYMCTVHRARLLLRQDEHSTPKAINCDDQNVYSRTRAMLFDAPSIIRWDNRAGPVRQSTTQYARLRNSGLQWGPSLTILCRGLARAMSCGS